MIFLSFLIFWEKRPIKILKIEKNGKIDFLINLGYFGLGVGNLSIFIRKNDF